MNSPLVFSLLAACAALMLLERGGAPVVLALEFKGDLKRESRWFAQYGQLGCTLVAALLIWRLDQRRIPHGESYFVVLLAAVFVAGLAAMLLKRLLGRVRPGHENAGRFLGPTIRHANYRESFPSSHSASAFAFSAILAQFYPQAAAIFWALAGICAAIRYLMDAHWPSDVVAGITLGYMVGNLVIHVMKVAPSLGRP
jgi:undecaprenyl-diphosphatase